MEAFLDRFARIPMLQKVLGMVLVCVMASAAFYFFMLLPLNDEQVKLQKEIATLEKSLRDKKAMVGDLSKYKREVEKLNQDYKKALKLLPDNSEIPSLLQKISSLAKKSGLEIKKFQPTPEIPQDFYAKVPVNLELEGSYNEITDFFHATGKLPRIVNIGSFSFAAPDGAKSSKSRSSKRTLTASCVATTFRFISK